MFFPKLRRKAKWVFVLLAVAFGGGFLIFGVGAGGSGIGDYVADLFNRPVSSGPSVGDAEERLAENPNDPEARLDLAEALSAQNQVDRAIAEYERYLDQVPRDEPALRSLAALYGQKIAQAQRAADLANAEVQEATLDQQVAPSNPFVQELARDRISESIASEARGRAQAAEERLQRSARLQADAYQQLTLLVENDPLLYLQLAQAAETAQEFESAIAAYEKFLEASPNDPNAEQVRERIDLLESFAGTNG